jgi:hypothetical protein
MTIYGNLETDGIEVYTDTDENGLPVVIIQDEQQKDAYPDTSKKRSELVNIATGIVAEWNEYY